MPFHIIVANIINVFKPMGFNISAPVLNNFKTNKIIKEEVKKEKEYGIFNKTTIHPKQIIEIQSEYKQKKRRLCNSKKIIE